MRINDFIDILYIDIGVPRTLWINDQYRSFIAAIEATGRVDADIAVTV